MMIGDILYVNEINYESFTSRAETIQLHESSRSFAIHRFHNRKRCVHAFSVRMFSLNHMYTYLIN